MRLDRVTRVSDEIPTASTADIAFLLIIFFMVTTVFSATRGLDFEIPAKQEIPEEIQVEEAVYIHVLSDGTYEVDRRPMALDDILGYLKPKLTNWPDKPVMIHAEPDAKYGDMLAVYDILRIPQQDKDGFRVKNISIPTLAEIEKLRAAASGTF
jgi:biopolymer transport protein ExbD